MNPSSIKGQVVFPDGVRPAEIGFHSDTGAITYVRHIDDAVEPFALVFPGFVDLHVHAREYPRPVGDPPDLEKWESVCRKETFRTAGEAAINGGVTLFAAMPNDPVPPDNPEAYLRKSNLAQSSACPVVLFGAVTSKSEPWGDIPYKVYLDSQPSPVAFTRWRDLEEAVSRYRGCRLFFHAEDPELIAADNLGARWKARPPEAEMSAVEKILELTAKLGLDSHICHVSTIGAVELIESYNRGGGRRVTCEVSPHHLFFGIREGRIRTALRSWVPEDQGYLLECNPPLRSEKDREFLVEALKNGDIDIMASDHAPHTLSDKRNGSPGMPHLDTLGAFAGWLLHDCCFTATRIAEVLSTAPSRKLAANLKRQHGTIEPGSHASFTVLDLATSTVVDEGGIKGRGPLKTLCGWSPFIGATFSAAVRTTVVSGKKYSF